MNSGKFFSGKEFVFGNRVYDFMNMMSFFSFEFC